MSQFVEGKLADGGPQEVVSIAEDDVDASANEVGIPLLWDIQKH